MDHSQINLYVNSNISRTEKKGLLFNLIKSIILSLLIVSFTALPVHATTVAFQKEQSYELSNIISMFMVDPNADYVHFLQTIREKNINIYWDNTLENPNGGTFKYHRSGVVGILLNNQGQVQYKQEWTDGLLKNTQTEIGLGATIHICGDLYWRPIMVEIMTAAPATIAKLTNETYPATQTLLKDYFIEKGFNVEPLYQKGDFSYGVNLYKLSLENKSPIWVVIKTNQGNSLGNSLIYIFYTYEDYTKDLEASSPLIH